MTSPPCSPPLFLMCVCVFVYTWREALLWAACCLTCVIAGYIYPHGRAFPLARPSLLSRAGAVEVGEGEATAFGCQLGEVKLGVVVRSLHQRLEVEPAVHQTVLHTEVVSRGQRLVASGAREAAQVVHGVARSHHHLRGRYPEVAARAPLHGEPSGTDTSSKHLIHRDQMGQTQRQKLSAGLPKHGQHCQAKSRLTHTPLRDVYIWHRFTVYGPTITGL